ncbi:hypothetical protein KIN20_016609 [Parelaphostrongylus tenuis]|uniref:SCP domain-containing protein n=1 Tax=Parelaphostrongylus tenuis TaxID=148309 RepID=A0AAD5N1J6_PARTN|nr:hypothetical protein KIN20_016609 [Parelaphostrongylus tenuis]
MSQATLLLLAVFALLRFGVCDDEYETDEFDTIPSFGCEGTAVSDFIRSLVLIRMNSIRSLVALGLYRVHGLSSSSDMNKLRWDCNLESIAERALQHCPANASFLQTTNAIILTIKHKMEPWYTRPVFHAFTAADAQVVRAGDVNLDFA